MYITLTEDQLSTLLEALVDAQDDKLEEAKYTTDKEDKADLLAAAESFGDLRQDLYRQSEAEREAGTAFTLTVEKDPEQQREGRTFTFQTDATDLPKTANYFNGKTCTVLEQVEPKLDYEPLAIGEMMWRVKFSDGATLDVYDHELQPIPRKKDLTTQIQGAEGKREPPTSTQEGNRKER